MNLPSQFEPSIGGTFHLVENNMQTCVRVYSKNHEGKEPMCMTAMGRDIEEAEELAKKWAKELKLPAHYCAPGAIPRKLKL